MFIRFGYGLDQSLMAKNYDSEEEVTSSNNNLSISFDELQDAFHDLH